MEMDKLVSLCKRRGFLFQSSEIYGGIQGFWDYGPLGVELKRNIKDAWWRDMVSGHDELTQQQGAPSTYEMTGSIARLSCIRRLEISGHYDLFHDFMVDCRQTKTIPTRSGSWTLVKARTKNFRRYDRRNLRRRRRHSTSGTQILQPSQ